KSEIRKRYRTVLCYGYSMGGYAALKYGRTLGADIVISFGPQISIAPDDVKRFDRRYLSHYQSDLHADMAIRRSDLCPQNYVISDMLHDQDAAHARAIAKLGNVSIIPAAAFAHSGPQTLIEAGVFSEFLSIFSEPGDVRERRARNIIRRA